MNSTVKARPCSLNIRSKFFSLLAFSVLLSLIPQSIPIVIISASAYLLGKALEVIVPENDQFLQGIRHGATSLFECAALLKLTEKATTYAAKSAFNSVKTLLVGAIVIYQAKILQSETSENGECSQKESRGGYLSQKNPKNSEYVQGAVRLSKESGEAVFHGGIIGSLSTAKDWFKALIFNNIP